MSIDIVAPILAGAIIAVSSAAYEHLKAKFHSKGKTETYGERLRVLVSQLSQATKNVDEILQEVAAVARDRESSINSLEIELRELESKERQMQERIDALSNVPIPVAEHFAEILKSSNSSNAQRDYLLFGAGVVVSILTTIALKLLGWS